MYSCFTLFSAQVIFWACCYFSACESPKDLPCNYLLNLLLNSSKLLAFTASFGKEFPRLLLPPARLISKPRSASLLSPSLCGNCSRTFLMLAAFLQSCLLHCALVERSVLDTSAGFQWSWTDVFWFVLHSFHLVCFSECSQALMEVADGSSYDSPKGLFQSSNGQLRAHISCAEQNWACVCLCVPLYIYLCWISSAGLLLSHRLL